MEDYAIACAVPVDAPGSCAVLWVQELVERRNTWGLMDIYIYMYVYGMYLYMIYHINDIYIIYTGW